MVHAALEHDWIYYLVCTIFLALMSLSMLTVAYFFRLADQRQNQMKHHSSRSHSIISVNMMKLFKGDMALCMVKQCVRISVFFSAYTVVCQDRSKVDNEYHTRYFDYPNDSLAFVYSITKFVQMRFEFFVVLL